MLLKLMLMFNNNMLIQMFGHDAVEVLSAALTGVAENCHHSYLVFSAQCDIIITLLSMDTLFSSGLCVCLCVHTCGGMGGHTCELADTLCAGG